MANNTNNVTDLQKRIAELEEFSQKLITASTFIADVQVYPFFRSDLKIIILLDCFSRLLWKYNLQ